MQKILLGYLLNHLIQFLNISCLQMHWCICRRKCLLDFSLENWVSYFPDQTSHACTKIAPMPGHDLSYFYHATLCCMCFRYLFQFLFIVFDLIRTRGHIHTLIPLRRQHLEPPLLWPKSTLHTVSPMSYVPISSITQVRVC